MLSYDIGEASSADVTVIAGEGPELPRLTETQRRVLVALCRPLRDGGSFSTPASNQQIADELHLSLDTVKTNLRTLFAAPAARRAAPEPQARTTGRARARVRPREPARTRAGGARGGLVGDDRAGAGGRGPPGAGGGGRYRRLCWESALRRRRRPGAVGEWQRLEPDGLGAGRGQLARGAVAGRRVLGQTAGDDRVERLWAARGWRRWERVSGR